MGMLCAWRGFCNIIIAEFTFIEENHTELAYSEVICDQVLCE
jgi:hypothetical protein